MKSSNESSPSLLLSLASAVALLVYTAIFLVAETEAAIVSIIIFGSIAIFLLKRFGKLAQINQAFSTHQRTMHYVVIAGVLILAAMFYDNHYNLFLIATVILYIVACLGMNIQLGYAGVINFSVASFYGIGGYTSAVLTMETNMPHLLIILAGGLVAAAVGSLLLLPVLRTSGHYAALVTIAFALLFKTFLEVNDSLGGPQGLQVAGMHLLGFEFNNNIVIGDIDISFYVPYVVLSLLLAIAAFTITKRLERSWIGLNMDAIRLDETAAACFGLSIPRWKIKAFTFGNFIIGIAGAVYGMMVGYIAPSNFTFGDSLILMSIVLLGGLGNPWGLVVATSIVIILPEKLQVIQEYRFLLYAIVVTLMLLYRPEGLLPRQLRCYIPGWRAQ